MNKELIFNEMIENILEKVTLGKFENGILFIGNEKDTILIKNETNIDYLTSVPHEFNGEKLHGNFRNSLAKEFIEIYSFDYLKNLYNKKVEAYYKNLELQEQNKYKLDDIYNDIHFMAKYTRYNKIEPVRFFYGMEKYGIEFNCNVNSLHSDNIQIYNNSDFTKFIFRHNYKNEELTRTELIERLKELSVEYEKEYIRRKEEEQKKKTEQEKQLKLEKAIQDLYFLNKPILLKSKNSYICFRNGVRFAVGEGKSGKYMNCNYHQFYDLIIKKNINEYYILNDNEKVYRYTNKDLKELPYNKILNEAV